ncbi:MAG: tetratricopeptide repeat protein [Acidimicrobiia bacterium]|nr:tetratricopeptide repeat protein [Acidimicrobiia bacterium]
MAAPQHALYLPRLVFDWLRERPTASSGSVHGTLIFADVSGFTALSDRLAIEMGRGGSEKVTSVMNEAFAELVEIVFLEHGDLLRFGGDALVALFTEEHHSGRACRAAIDMRDAIGDIDAGDIDLNISIGIASGDINVNVIGREHREMILSGPTVDEVIGAESGATAGQIFVSPVLAEEISNVATKDPSGFWQLKADPDSAPLLDEPEDLTFTEDASFSDFISPDFRNLLTLTLQQGEHRPASIGFVKFSGLAALDESDRAVSLESLFKAVTNACQEFDVAYVSNDIDKDGGKFILAAGVPRRSSGEEEMALALHAIVARPHHLKVSGGCARGYVFSGDLGAPSRRVFTVMGDTVNLAARLASAAHAGQVLITEAALERSRGAFETNRLAPISLKGKSKDVSPFEILSSEITDTAVATIPLFGRDTELRHVARLVEKGIAGSGTVLALVAADGIGKGHLAKVALEQIHPEVRKITVALGSGQTHAAAKGLMAALAGIEQGASTVEQLTAAVKQHRPKLTEWLPLLARNWSIELPGTETTNTLGVEFVAARMARITAELLCAAGGNEPTVILVEDLDLADQASQAFLHEVVMQVEHRPWSLILTSQSDPEWGATVTVVQIAPFDDATAQGFVRWVLDDRVLPASSIALIVERGKGNPHMLSELTLSAVEGGTVPESVEAAALAKLDRLDPRDKQLLMYAAVLGNEARIDILASLLPEIASAIEDSESWNRLAGFIDSTVIGKLKFKDPLVRDVAYSMLPQRRRQEIHELVGNAIEKRARRRPERFVGDLSYHYHLAHDWERSANYSRQAAVRAEHSFELVKASELWRRAIEAAESMSTPPAELPDIYEHLGDAHDSAGMFPEAESAYTKAEDLVSDGATRNRLARKRGLVDIQLGNPGIGRERLDAVLASDEAATVDQLEAMLAIAGLETRTGHPEEAARWCRKVIEQAGPEGYPPQRARAYHIMALASSDAGLPEAEEQGKQALHIYEEIDDKAGISKALNNLGYTAFYKGDWEACEEYHLRNRETTRELGDLLSRALAGYNLGELYLEQGRFAEGQPLLEETLAAFRGARHKVGEAVTRIALGRLHSRLARIEQANTMLDRALSVAEEANATQYRVDVALARTEVALITGHIDDACDLINETLQGDIEDTTLHARLVTLQCYAMFCADGSENTRVTFARARELAEKVGALHLRYAVVEVDARLFNVENDRLEELAGQLRIQARPVFRTG